MTVEQLGTLLNDIHLSSTETMQFAHYAWSSAPSGDYGVYAEELFPQFDADNNFAESSIEGTIDYFTRDASGTPIRLIRNALIDNGVYHYLNSVQYEDNTGYIHYEVVFRINGT